MAGSPTCVVVSGAHVLAGVDSSDGNYTNPSGQLVVMSLATQQIIATLDVGGQPDSIMKSPNGKHLVVVIENQRDEELGDGETPQMFLPSILNRTWLCHDEREVLLCRSNALVLVSETNATPDAHRTIRCTLQGSGAVTRVYAKTETFWVV